MHYADKTAVIEHCVSCNDSVSGLKLLGTGNYDLVFLDYNMPSLSGQDVLELKQDESKVIMITSDKNFAVESYRYTDVIDYLVKPLSYDRFLESVDRFSQRHTKQKEAEDQKKPLMIKDGNKWVPINIDAIQYIKSESNYCLIHTVNSSIMSLINLKSLLDKLPKNFLQTHRSYIINTDFIEYLTKENISINGKMIPISNKYKSQVKAFIDSRT